MSKPYKVVLVIFTFLVFAFIIRPIWSDVVVPKAATVTPVTLFDECVKTMRSIPSVIPAHAEQWVKAGFCLHTSGAVIVKDTNVFIKLLDAANE